MWECAGVKSEVGWFESIPRSQFSLGVATQAFAHDDPITAHGDLTRKDGPKRRAARI
jgi:hypothetical protein